MPETDYDAPKAPGADVSDKQARYTRILAFLVVAATLAAGIASKAWGMRQGVLIPVFIAYPPLIHRLAEYLLSRAQPVTRVNAMLYIADAVMLGIAIAGMQFSIVASLMILMIVASNAMAVGGVQTFVMTLAITLLGCLVGVLMVGLHFLSHASTPTLLTVVPVMGVLVYMAIAAMFSQQQREILLKAQQEVRAQREQAIALTRRLSKYLPPQIYGALFSGRRDAKLETRRKKLTVFFSDVQGFTNLSDEIPLEKLTAVLNQYLNEMTRIALKHGGTIDKFMGDGIMIFFGDPASKGTREDAIACVSMAVEMQQHMQMLRQHWKEQSINTPLEIRIGINTGLCTVGNFGAESRMDYTILGREVNLASRLESSARPGTVIISEPTYELVKEDFICRSCGKLTVKGISGEIQAWEVVNFRRNLGSSANVVSLRRPGITLMLDIDKIRNYEQPAIIASLSDLAKILRTTSPKQLDGDATGYLLRLKNEEIDLEDREKLKDLVDRCLRKLKSKSA